MIVNIPSTHQSVCDGLSRIDLLAWVNKKLKANFTKVDELCTGAAYCQLIHSLFPKFVQIKRVKFYTNLEHEFIDNFKILQTAFQKLNVQKAIPIDRLVRGKFQDNIEFLQWFKKFYDANDQQKDYDPELIRNGAPMGYGSVAAKKNGEKRTKDCSPARGPDIYRDQRSPKEAVKSDTDLPDEMNGVLKRSLTRTEMKHEPVLTENGNHFDDDGKRQTAELLTKANKAFQLRLKQLQQNLQQEQNESKQLKTELTVMQGDMESLLGKFASSEKKRNCLVHKLQSVLDCCEKAKAAGELSVDSAKIYAIIEMNCDDADEDSWNVGDIGAGDQFDVVDGINNDVDSVE